MYNFEGQTVIVTGGTRGIGAGITKAFLNACAKVIAIYAGNDENAYNFQKEMGENLEIKKLDISKEENVKNFFNEIEDKKIDILVNNAGVRIDSLAATMSQEDWQKVIDINLSGSFYMSKYAISNFLKNRYGRIVNISSIGGKIGIVGQANYAATKAGQIAMSKVMAKEVARKGITVNNVAPGFIETELLDGLSEDLISEYKKSIPMKKFGKVEDVANAVLFLASKEASYITGSTIEVSGGL